MNKMFDSSYVDPFDLTNPPQKLINFATGAVAWPDIDKSMTCLIRKGTDLAITFVVERLVREHGQAGSKSFYAVLAGNLQHMSTMGSGLQTRDETVASMQFVCALYGNPGYQSLN